MRFSEINKLLKLIFLLGIFCITNAANLRCYDGSMDNFSIISLNTPDALLSSACFDSERETVIYAFGFQENVADPTVNAIIGTYLSLNNVNVLLLDWEQEANIPILGRLSYIGNQLGQAIVRLKNANFELSSLHLIGFSLGAHLVGYAGKFVASEGYLLPRITGLDPAGPIYQEFLLLSGLDTSAAKFVDVIHSNPGGLGTEMNLGTVDIYANCGCRAQPGCENNSIYVQPTPNGCSHNRVWLYFVEALKDPDALPARAASSCNSWRAGNGTDQIIYIGDNIDKTAKGKFYLRTNSKGPYSLGAAGTQPREIQIQASPDFCPNLQPSFF